MAQFIDTETKQQIIKEIRDEGKKVVDVASSHNVSTKAIYSWLRDGVGGNSKDLEIAKLKRENEQLYGILGIVRYHRSRRWLDEYGRLEGDAAPRC
jgi:transposase-like protein